MRLILLGLPGSGKEELARRLSKDFSIPVLTLEKTLTDMAAEQTELGRIVKEAAFAGKFSDEVIMAALRVRLDDKDAENGFILEDFPRSVGQAETLDVLLKGLRTPLNAVVKIDIEADDLMEHLVGQITCQNCGEKYNIYNNPPIVEGMCNVCGERIRRRPDDYEENIANRLRNCEIIMSPLEKFYTAQGTLKLVPGNHPNKTIEKLAVKLLKSLPPVKVPDSGDTDTLPMDESLLKALVPPRSASDDENRPRRRGRPRRNPLPETTAVKAKKNEEKAAPASAEKPKETVRKADKKAAAKKTPASGKAPAKKADAKSKAPVKKAPAKKTVAKKAAPAKAVKKSAAKPAAKSQSAAKKATPASKKSTAKKAAGKKVAVRKTAAKAAPKKKAPIKKAAAKKVAAKKTTVKKAPAAKKPVTKKAVAKKVAAKKKPVTKKSAARAASPAAKKKVVQKKVTKQAVSKKTSPKKTAAKKKARG